MSKPETDITTLTLQQFIDRLTALPESARSLPVTWRSPATGACFSVESTVNVSVRDMYHHRGRSKKATYAAVVIE